MNHDLARKKRGFSAVPFFGDLVALSRMLRDKKAGWGPKLIALLAIVYVISPVDAIPELIAPWIAWLDDVGLILALRLLLSRRLEPYRYPLFANPAATQALPSSEASSEASSETQQPVRQEGLGGPAERVVIAR